jgi:hypothetical protein
MSEPYVVSHSGRVPERMVKSETRRSPIAQGAGEADYWSRKLRIFRERDGCFSLRSAFASI